MRYDDPFRSEKKMTKNQNSEDLDVLEALKKRKNQNKENLLQMLR